MRSFENKMLEAIDGVEGRISPDNAAASGDFRIAVSADNADAGESARALRAANDVSGRRDEGLSGGSSDVREGDVEALLRAHYRAQRGVADRSAKAAAMEAAVREVRRLAEDAQAADGAKRAETHGQATDASVVPARLRIAWGRACETLRFVADQARFMSARSWLLQAFVVAVAAAFALADAESAVSGLYGCFAAAAIAVCGLPEAASSRTYGVMELERSCLHDARSVAAARMAVLACSNAVGIAVVAACVAYSDADVSFAFALVCAFAPYCITVAGCLPAARRFGGAGALAAAAAWGAVVVAAAYCAAARAPWLYAQASLWIWAVVAAASLIWVAFEVRAWLADAVSSARMLSFDSSCINR
ncbi:MAG: hypothetical protein Q4B69_00265 [Slackia sp.]|nr:hypothetical protein [Slackia sp.]